MRKLVLFIVSVMIISLASAAFSVGNASDGLEESYGAGSTVKGWLNVSFSNHDSNSILSGIFGGSINLIDLLSQSINSGYDYDCVPQGCGTGYSVSNPQTSKQMTILAKQSDEVGLKLTGDLAQINSVNLTITSDAAPACFNQIEVDFFDDGTVDIVNDKMLASTCSFYTRTGCFNSSYEQIREYSIGNDPYCQRITLSQSPGFRLGSWVKKESGEMNLSMKIYDLSGNDLNKKCTLPTATSEGSVISCDVEYTVAEEKDHYVCVAKENGDGSYKVRGYGNTCAFVGVPPRTENAAFQIQAIGLSFASPGQITVSNKFVNGNQINTAVEQYLISNYGNEMNCPAEGCIIPIHVEADQDQTVTFNNLQLQYVDVGTTVENNYYTLNTTSAKVSSGYGKLYLDGANLSVPSTIGNATFRLDVDGSEALSKEIRIEELPTIEGLSPSVTASAVPTVFRVLVNETLNISRFNWEFGDNQTDTSTTNQISHTYNSSGNYELKVSVTDTSQRTSYKIFDITVKTPEEVINQTLAEKIQDIENVKEDVAALSAFDKGSVENKIEVGGIEADLKKIELDYNTASTEDEYKEIVTRLLALDVPSSVFKSKEASDITFYPDVNDINLDVISEALGGSVDSDDEDKYQEAILRWSQDNVDVSIDYTEYSADYERGKESISKVFRYEVSSSGSFSYNPVIFLKKLEGMEFKENLNMEEEGDYLHTDLNEESIVIEFSTNESLVDFTNLEAFVTPPLNRLSVSGGRTGGPEKLDGPNWTLFSLIILLLIVVAVIAFIFMQIWYKKNYEKSLFKNKNNLYNLMSYIESSKKKGMKENELEANLRRTGWREEQIKYALDKHAGRSGGIIDFSKWFGKKKKEEPKNENPFMKGPRRF